MKSSGIFKGTVLIVSVNEKLSAAQGVTPFSSSCIVIQYEDKSGPVLKRLYLCIS